MSHCSSRPVRIHEKQLNITWVAMLILLATALIWPLPAGALPAPTGSQFITPYTAIASPVVNGAAAASQPIAVGGAVNESGDLALRVETSALDAPMDAYFAIIAPRLLPGTILLANGVGGLEPFTGTLVPWKTHITTLNESLFGTIPLALLPGGDYSFYLLLAPAGSTNPLGGNYFVWSSTLSLTPTVEEFADAVITRFGTDVEGPLALLLGLDNGYSLLQIVNAVFAGRFTGDGVVLNGSGAPLTPAQTPLGLIIRDTTKSLTSIKADTSLPAEKAEVAIAIKALMTAIALRLGIDPIRALGLSLIAIATSQADNVDVGAVIGAVLAEFFVLGPDSVSLADGPPDDPASKPLEGNGESSKVFRADPGTGNTSHKFTEELCPRTALIIQDKPGDGFVYHSPFTYSRYDDFGSDIEAYCYYSGTRTSVGGFFDGVQEEWAVLIAVDYRNEFLNDYARCGAAGNVVIERKEGVVPQVIAHSTQRDVQAWLALPVDDDYQISNLEAVLTETVNNAVAAGVGAPCP